MITEATTAYQRIPRRRGSHENLLENSNSCLCTVQLKGKRDYLKHFFGDG